MNFLRILKEKENRIKSIPEPLSSYDFLNLNIINIHSDLFHGFDTKKNTLSLFQFNSAKEIERVISHSEVIRTRLENLPKKVYYVELSMNYLKSLDCSPINTPIKNNIYDTFVANSHYDITNLDNIKLSNLIYKLNNDILNNTLQVKSLTKEQVFNGIKNNYDNKNLLLEDYKNIDKINDFFTKVPAQ